MPVEDRIDQLARLVLVVLLLATLGWISSAKAQSKAPEFPPQGGAPLILIAKPIGDGRHVGFAINRPTDMTLGKLFAEHGPSQKVPGPVSLGGPSNTEYIFAMVRSKDSPGGESLRLAQDLFIAVDAETVDRIIEVDPSRARFFAGLIAWRPGELQEGLKRGIWYVEGSDSDLVMRNSTEGLWEELVRRSERRANAI